MEAADSPGVAAGDYLYVSGQTGEQLGDCIRKIRVIAAAAGFPFEGMAYVQVSVAGANAFSGIDKEWAALFPRDGPARSIIGVAGLPRGAAIEVSAVLVRDPATKRSVFAGEPGTVPDAVSTRDRVFLSDCRGVDTEAALARTEAVLKAAGLDARHLVFVNPYLAGDTSAEAMNLAYAKHFEFGNTPARATIFVNALPGGARVAFTGLAVRELSHRRAIRPKNMPPSPTASPCVFAEDTLYCSAKSGFIPGPHSGIYASTVEGQLRQTMRNLLDGLEEAGMSFENVVATTLYVDDMRDLPAVDPIYKQYFNGAIPARAVVQQRASGERKANERGQWPTLEQISLVAVRNVPAFGFKAMSPEFWDLLSRDAEIQTVARGFGFTEGPVWDPKGFLYVSDEVTNQIFRVYPDGRRDEVIRLGDPDGNTYDRQHRLVDCASVLRALIAVQADGKYTMLAERFEGKRFNSPNDVVTGPDGALYFTDPNMDLVKGEKQELPFQGVFRLGKDGAVRLLIKDLAEPNGLAFSPDGHHLYVDDSERKDIHIYDVAPDGGVSNAHLFAKMDPSGDPDGMRVDTNGNLYVSGAGGIWVFDPAGQHLGTILLREPAANLTWGDPDYGTLYITSSTSVVKVRTKATGFVPYR